MRETVVAVDLGFIIAGVQSEGWVGRIKHRKRLNGRERIQRT